MRIAVSAESKNDLDSIVAEHFGRCPAFVLVDVEKGVVGTVKSIDNPFYPHHEPGQVPNFVASQGAQVMLTGGMGGRAIQFFQQAGIEAVTGAYGTVQQALDMYLAGRLGSAAPCSESVEHGHGDVHQHGC